jgi:Na+-transporting NADH:ubiquinone oxidoreductase subunit B
MIHLPKKKVLIQKPMMGTTYALFPAAIFGIYNFGWRALLVIATSFVFGFATEAFFTYRQGKPVTSAVFVTCMLFALIMPPSVPLWIVAVGIVFAITFGKMVFGGFGQNPYNPAMVGRCFVYISFPIAMTSHWNQALDFFPRGLNDFLVDAMTTATPLVAAESGDAVPIWRALFGFTGGSIGETSFLMVAAGGAYIIYKKWANWKVALSTAIFAFVPQTILYLTGTSPINPFYMVVTGGFALGVLFMTTDPVSSPRTDIGRYAYGAIIGICTVMIRTWGNFAEGFMFALLLGNTFAPIIDYHEANRQKAKKAAAKAAKAAEGAGV